MDFQKFYMGDVYDAYKYLGAHVEEDGVVFRTFAPQAEKVMIIGEFNNWRAAGGEGYDHRRVQ